MCPQCDTPQLKASASIVKRTATAWLRVLGSLNGMVTTRWTYLYPVSALYIPVQCLVRGTPPDDTNDVSALRKYSKTLHIPDEVQRNTGTCITIEGLTLSIVGRDSVADNPYHPPSLNAGENIIRPNNIHKLMNHYQSKPNRTASWASA